MGKFARVHVDSSFSLGEAVATRAGISSEIVLDLSSREFAGTPISLRANG